MQVHAGLVHIFHVHQHAALGLAKVHQRAHIVVGGVDVGVDEGLLLLDDAGGVRVGGGVVDDLHRAVGHRQPVLDAGGGGDEVKVELPFQPLGDDLHVQEPQEPAAEAEAQGGAGLGFKSQRRVVELQFFQRVLQVGVVGAVGRVDAAEHHRRHGAETGQRFRRGARGRSDGIAHAGVPHGLDAGGQVAHLAGFQLVAGGQAGGAHMAHLHQLELGAGAHQADGVAGAHGALEHAHVDDDALVAVVDGVEDQRFQRRFGVACGGRDLFHDGFQHVLDAYAQLGRDPGRFHAGQADHVLHLFGHGVGVGAGQVDLVQDRHHFQVVIQRQVAVGQGLGFHALAGVHHQHRAFAGGQAAADLVLEVHMARRVDQVEFIGLTVVRLVAHGDGAGLDGDAALLLDVHIIQHLVGHRAFIHAVGQFQHAVRQRGFAVVDVGDDAKIADRITSHQVSSKLLQILQIFPSCR